MHETEKENRRKATDQQPRCGEDATTCPNSKKKNVPLVKTYQPPLPFLSQAKQDKQAEDYKKFLEHIKSHQINIPFIEAAAQIPKYAMFLKNLLTN